ncbi:MAG: DNA ligase D [Candidatus Eiseniibacteriota bacterium]
MSATRKENLDLYRKKRDPARTPEPFGPAEERVARGVTPRAPRFVVQKHWARQLHYDFRLELDGTLKSWSVPKGPSTRAEERRLAVHVEDHPLEYASFEGVIPAGNYGAGSVIVWDHGPYGSFKEDDLLEQYVRGKLELELFGFKLRGRWTLVRMGKKDKEWLLLKKVDGGVSEREAVDRYPESVISGLTVEEMRDVPGTLDALRDLIRSFDAPRRDVDVKDVGLMLATLTERAPSGPDWGFEIKYDGVRVLVQRDGEQLRMLGRSGEDITKRYPEVASGLASLAVPRFLLDGEIIAEDESGRPSFGRLQARMGLSRPRDIEAAMAKVPVRGVFFDCLALEGHDLRKLPLVERKELLARTLPPIGPVQRSDYVPAHGPEFFEAASELGLEGIIAKKLASSYQSRRSADWLKIKCQKRQEFVIGGYTDPQGSRARFGALHVGLYDGPTLVYVTKVGTGFDEEGLDRIAALLEPLARSTSPFDVGTPGGRGHHWVEPRLVCEVRFTEWTRDGGLRHPTFLGLRPDRKPEECRREEPVSLDSAVADGSDGSDATDDTGDTKGTDEGTSPRPTAPARGFSSAGDASARTVKLTNVTKKYWPEGYTKGDLIRFYEAVAPLLLPYLEDRPVVLTRYPDGIEGKSFFQKDAPVYTPEWVRTVTIHSNDADRDIRYFVIDDVESLRYVANMGTIPLHVWCSRVGSLDHPDWCVLDLDPKGAPFTQVVQVARTLKTILEELELESFVKTSGATGLHILLPMGRQYTDEEVRQFARLLALLTVDTVPEISTVTRSIRAREGKVYVDYGQNGRGNTIVSPYSVRPLPGAPASCPLRWDEVTARLDPARYTIETIPRRFEKMADPLTRVLGKGVDMKAAIARIARRMEKTGAGNRAEDGGEDEAPAKRKRRS